MSGQDDSGYHDKNWRNWAGNLSSVPDDILQPSNIGDVRALVRNREEKRFALLVPGIRSVRWW